MTGTDGSSPLWWRLSWQQHLRDREKRHRSLYQPNWDEEDPLLSIISALCHNDASQWVDTAFQHYVITASKTSTALSAGITAENSHVSYKVLLFKAPWTGMSKVCFIRVNNFDRPISSNSNGFPFPTSNTMRYTFEVFSKTSYELLDRCHEDRYTYLCPPPDTL